MTTTDTTLEVPVFTPSVDVLTNETTVRVRADLPGVQPDALKLTLHDGVLQLNGLAPRHRFVRKIRLAWPISADADIEAKLSDGVLTVDLARADAPSPVRQVVVH
jgi:HSP20 family molecular chaperone IbpA